MSDWQKYMDSVMSGQRMAGRLERLAVERTSRLMQDDRYFMDFKEAERVLGIVSLFRHTKGQYYGQPFQLFPFQAYYFAHVFGLKRKDTGLRLTRKTLLVTAKKSGKSELAGAQAVLMAFFDNEPRAECYSAANKFDQALFCWDAARVICKQLAADSESFAQQLQLYNSFNNKNIINTAEDSFFKPIASDSKTLDGVNPHLAEIDEYHEAKDSSIPDNMSSGMVLRSQPMLSYFTTRGFNVFGPLWQLEKVAVDVLEGKKEDDSFFPLVFAMDEGDDWHDKSKWPKANPGIGRAPTWDGIEAEYTKAINEGATAEVNFKTKNLNIWVRQAKTWITDKVWMRGGRPISLDSLKGRRCFGAADLSSRRDLSCKGLLFPPLPGEKDFVFLQTSYCPAENIEARSRQDGVPYQQWAADGDLVATPGNVIDYEYIEQDILKDHGNYQLERLNYDPAFATEIMTRLAEKGVPVQEFTQYYKNFNRAITELDKLTTEGRLVHGGDPVLRWCAGNVAIKRNATGLQMFDRANSKEKIDPMVVLAMCLAGYLSWLEGGNDNTIRMSFF